MAPSKQPDFSKKKAVSMQHCHKVPSNCINEHPNTPKRGLHGTHINPMAQTWSACTHFHTGILKTHISRHLTEPLKRLIAVPLGHHSTEL